ncbi:MAG: hypothetical protein ACMVY4_17685 [Minwuia sp.]|uniref:hypothetical protein n=1 Tax=Minwuia sp. TaxID=2493630 RepID=UPI003A8AAA02
MPTLLTIVTTDDIIDDVDRDGAQERDPDVEAALRHDAKARQARHAASRGRKMVKALRNRSNEDELS